MSLDLAIILVILTIVSGLIWLLDVLFLARRRVANRNKLPVAHPFEKTSFKADEIPLVIELSRSLFPIFFIVLCLRSFLIEPFRIPSGSMMPTLLIGDFILVNKFIYGIRLPVIHTKIISLDSPERGDVVVFRYPEDPSLPFIKRVVGLPGDHLVYHVINKTLYINGEPVEQDIIGVYQGVGAGSNMTGAESRTEYLSEPPHSLLVFPRQTTTAKYQEMTVPQGHYFVLGDNRDNSRDSRYWGTVPEEYLIGKAFLIWMNWDLQNGGISWQRLGTSIQ